MEYLLWIATFILVLGLLYVFYRILKPDPLMEVFGEEENVPHIDVYTTIEVNSTLYSEALKDRLTKSMPLLEDADRRTYKRKAHLSIEDIQFVSAPKPSYTAPPVISLPDSYSPSPSYESSSSSSD